MLPREYNVQDAIRVRGEEYFEQGIEQGIGQGIINLITALLDINIDSKTIIMQVKKQYNLSEDEASEWYRRVATNYNK